MSDDASTALPDLDALAADLSAVDAALAAIEDGSYGRCVICGDAVSDGILATDPVAVHCEVHRGEATTVSDVARQTASESTGVASD